MHNSRIERGIAFETTSRNGAWLAQTFRKNWEKMYEIRAESGKEREGRKLGNMGETEGKRGRGYKKKGGKMENVTF